MRELKDIHWSIKKISIKYYLSTCHPGLSIKKILFLRESFENFERYEDSKINADREFVDRENLETLSNISRYQLCKHKLTNENSRIHREPQS